MTTFQFQDDLPYNGAANTTFRIEPEEYSLTLDFAGEHDESSIPENYTALGLTWRLRYIDLADESIPNDQPIPIPTTEDKDPGIVAYYTPTGDHELLDKYIDLALFETMVKELTKGTPIITNPDATYGIGTDAKFHEIVNWRVRLSFGGNWLSGDVPTATGLKELRDGLPLLSQLSLALAEVTQWSEVTQILGGFQLAIDTDTDQFIDLTDETQPAAATKLRDLDLLARPVMRLDKNDPKVEDANIKAGYWPGDDSDFIQEPDPAGTTHYGVDQLRMDRGQAQAAIVLQRQRLIQEQNRLTFRLFPHYPPPVDLYDVIEHRERYFRIMSISAHYGQTDGGIDCIAAYIKDKPASPTPATPTP